MISLLIEAALRTLLVALAVAAGLHLLRVSNVLAQKKVWCLVLAAALLMPLLVRWQWLSASALIRVPLQSWGQSTASQPAQVAPAPSAALPPDSAQSSEPSLQTVWHFDAPASSPAPQFTPRHSAFHDSLALLSWRRRSAAPASSLWSRRDSQAMDNRQAGPPGCGL